MKTPYAVKFTIKPKSNDTFSTVQQRVISFLEANAKKSLDKLIVGKPLNFATPDGKFVIDVKEQFIQNAVVWEIQWDYVGANKPYTRRVLYRLASIIKSNKQEIEFSLEVQLLLRDETPIGSDATLSEPPKLVGLLVDEFDCYVGKKRLTTKPVGIGRDPDSQTFIEKVLKSKLRKIPIVLFSQYEFSIHNLALELAGLAEVYFCYGDHHAQTLQETLGKEFACTKGDIRVYYPEFPTTPSPIWKLTEKERLKQIRQQIAEKTAYHFMPGRIYREALDAIDDYERSIRTQEMKALVAKIKSEEGEESSKILEIYRNEAERLREENFQMKEELKQLRHDLETANDNLRFAFVTPTSKSESVEERVKEDIALTTVLDAVERARTDFGDTLWFHNKAVETAETSDYQDAFAVYDGLRSMHYVALMLRVAKAGGLQGSLEDTFRQFRQEYAPHINSNLTKSRKTQSKYTVTKGGERFDLEEHLKFGSSHDPKYCLRIYFSWDENSQKWIVGHVGDHLPTDAG